MLLLGIQSALVLKADIIQNFLLPKKNQRSWELNSNVSNII